LKSIATKEKTAMRTVALEHDHSGIEERIDELGLSPSVHEALGELVNAAKDGLPALTPTDDGTSREAPRSRCAGFLLRSPS
jgi:hypothetical protein